jgi:hypothetical protein
MLQQFTTACCCIKAVTLHQSVNSRQLFTLDGFDAVMAVISKQVFSTRIPLQTALYSSSFRQSGSQNYCYTRV